MTPSQLEVSSAKIPAWRRALSGSESQLEPLWVSGLALLLVLIENWQLPYQIHNNEWIQYLTLGTVFPACLLWLTLGQTSRSQTTSNITRVIKISLAVFCALILSVYMVAHYHWIILALSILTLVLDMVLHEKHKHFQITRVSTAVDFLVTATAWTVAWQILWWDPITNWSPLRSVGRLCLASVLLYGVLCSLPLKRPERELVRKRSYNSQLILNASAVLVLGLASLRPYHLFDGIAFHHWGFYVGPAELVRQGGWLLWDVPSQYGFLSILTLAYFPAESVWQSLYILNAALLFLSGCGLFYVLRSLRAGPINFCFSLLVTLAALFLLPGWAPEQLGPQGQPNIGPFRFFWCYALIAILIAEYHGEKRKANWQVPFVGCLIWLLGVLWSSESVLYCTVIWAPAYTLMVWRRSGMGSLAGAQRRVVLPQTVGRLLLPVLALLLIISGITLYYKVKLGHPPDWYAFVEYARSYSTAYIVSSLSPQAPFWLLFMIFCLLSTVGVFLTRSKATWSALSLIGGTWGLLWATASWFVAIGSPSRLLNLSPIFCLAIAVILLLLPSMDTPPPGLKLIRISLSPVLAALLTAAFGSRTVIPSLRSLENGYVRDIDERLLPMDPSLYNLLTVAQVKPTDALIIVADNHLGLWPIVNPNGRRFISSPRYWLPVAPFLMFDPLPLDRRKLYISRFINRTGRSGWLIQHQDELKADWLLAQLKLTHRRTKIFSNTQWQLMRFELQVTKKTAERALPTSLH